MPNNGTTTITVYVALIVGIMLFLCNLVIQSPPTQAKLIDNDTIISDSINLLNNNDFIWKPQIQAKVFQRNAVGLNIIVDTMADVKLYHRAYLETDLTNLTTPPVALFLDYKYESDSKNTVFAVAIAEEGDYNNSPLCYYSLDKNSTNAIFPLEKDITNKPIEFRLYAITNEPTLSVLNVKEARLLLDL